MLQPAEEETLLEGGLWAAGAEDELSLSNRKETMMRLTGSCSHKTDEEALGMLGGSL